MNRNDANSNDASEAKSDPRSRTTEILARALRVFAALSALALLASFSGFVLMLGVGHWLVKQDSLQKANAIAVLSGNFPARAMEAADLYRNGYASEIWLTHPGPQSGVLADMGIHYPSEADFNFQVLRHQGVPAKAIHILDRPIVNTADELDVISSTLQQKGADSVIVVTDKAHTRRVRTLWTRYDASRGKAIVHGVAGDEFDPSAWWKNTESTHQVFHELLGMINVWAGLPMRTVFPARGAFAANELQAAPKLVRVETHSSFSRDDD
jgi:uncharacterized SAM-binding protein YcdF (DUF218 family)